MISNLERIQPPVSPVDNVVIPEAVNFSLKNGVQVYLIEAGTEDIMRIEFVFRAGQIKETRPLIASTCNMMLTEGTVNYSAEALNKELDYYGIFINQTAEKDRAGVVLYCLSKHIEKALTLGHEIMFRPVFPDSELTSLLNKRIRWFLVNREKVQNLAYDQFFESIFGKDHPYGYQIKESDFQNITTPQLSEFHSRYYVPENMAIIVSGKIHENTRTLLELLFGNLKAELEDPELLRSLQRPSGLRKVHINKEGAVQTAIRIGSVTINKRHPDYPGLKVTDAVLGGYFGSRLMKNIREDKGYTYGINSSLSSLDLSGYKVISTDVGKVNTRKAIDEIFREIQLLQQVPVDNEELTVVKNYMSGEMLRMFDGPFALADSFRSAWEFGLDNSYYYRLAEKIRTIDAYEIMDLAKKYYNIDDLYEITAGAE
jgi:zinc protease